MAIIDAAAALPSSPLLPPGIWSSSPADTSMSFTRGAWRSENSAICLSFSLGAPAAAQPAALLPCAAPAAEGDTPSSRDWRTPALCAMLLECNGASWPTFTLEAPRTPVAAAPAPRHRRRLAVTFAAQLEEYEPDWSAAAEWATAFGGEDAAAAAPAAACTQRRSSLKSALRRCRTRLVAAGRRLAAAGCFGRPRTVQV